MQNAIEYDQIVAIDYAERNVAVARLTKRAKKPQVIEGAMKVADLQQYLSRLSGRILLIIEETTTAHYLYCELRGYVEKVLICDPFTNRLLGSGPKNDKIDAAKLAMLGRGGLLKEVFHACDELMSLRQLVSAYADAVYSSVRLQNQKAALCRQLGATDTAAPQAAEPTAEFIINGVDRQLAENDSVREKFVREFMRWKRRDIRLRHLCNVPGIGIINAVKVLARVINARRFPKSGNFLGYCGLVMLEKKTGGRWLGQRRPRYCRTLKSVYKTAAMAAIGGNNDMNDFYEEQLRRGVAEHNARHAVARQIAVATYGMLKHGTPYQPYKWRKKNRPIVDKD